MEYYEHKLDPVGVRPDWLDKTDLIDFNDTMLGWDNSGTFRWCGADIELGVDAIRIPSDHWAVPALKQGFKPCLEKPADYDGGETLWSDGLINNQHGILQSFYWSRERKFHVIGYKPKATTEAKASVSHDILNGKIGAVTINGVRYILPGPDDTRLMAIIERIASNGVASITDVRECEAIVAERRPVDPLVEVLRFEESEIHTSYEKRAAFFRAELARRNLKIVEA